ncbi:MAG: sugar ABC transporter permease [Bacillus sp. (in: Bacteria)]|nr:sugar ABC transporter permease [Bacillus sp. (in: firmicutes)]
MRQKSKLLKGEMYSAYILLLPIFIFYFIFTIIPVKMSIYLSFTDYSGFNVPKWVGLENYKYIINDPLAIKALFNTIYFAIGTVIFNIIMALLLAVLLNQSLRGRAFFRNIVYLPVVTPMLAAAFVWKFIYDPSPSGLLNYLLSFLGIKSQQWLSDVRFAMLAIIFMSVWKGVGYNMVIYLAGLQGIPEQLYEVAEMDGANFLYKFLYITIPLLKPVTTFIFITSTINAFQAFEQIYGMTEGGPVNSTLTLAYLIYARSFKSLEFGNASALAVLLGILVFIFSIFYIKKIAKEE